MRKAIFGHAEYATVNNRIRLALEDKHPLVAVHRGSPGGSIVENTAPAVHAAIVEGADIVEIDVIRSADGAFFVFHDGYEGHYFNLQRSILDLTAAEIESLQYEVFVQAKAKSYGVEKLSTILNRFPNTILNIDRSWSFWDTLLPYLDEFDCADRVLLKAPGDSSSLWFLDRHETPYPFMPIVQDEEELQLALSHSSINTVAVEVLARDDNCYFADASVLRGLKERGFLIHLNALNLANRRNLYLGWDDETSVLIGPDQGWGKLIDQGADMIQTDWPGLLNHYISGRTLSARDDGQ
ncbi:glycerophosphodiester phosphodiesterase family protein [Corynebacterium sanguinis]|uniref:Glycerophosphodiester phosphodiesterase family protein n=1 Tax=Corynebacterium sanguinis TaxID=2594913 RepID=A0A6C1TWN0_9CORY|nr:glycerophosphodiester phosphodiesterase family protein [Corynebacterium sanguinis]TVS26417.1 glycerophosphodiester phosphodiesterase family protein [Corynebacterium sanguinis]